MASPFIDTVCAHILVMKTKPHKHQLEIFEDSKNREFFGLLLEQGLGKTKIIIDTAYHLYGEQEIGGVLVLAPNGVHLNWHYEELPIHGWEMPTEAAIWRASLRKHERMALKSVLEPKGSLRWLFMNIEAIRYPRGYETAEKFLKSTTCLAVIDESTVIKSPKAKQTKAALMLSRLAKYRRIMTGTPITQDPLDVFTQARFLSDKALPYTSYTAFRRTFAIEEPMVLGNRAFNKIVGFRNLDHLKEILKPFTVRLLKEDCLDLPEKVYSRQFVELTREQEKLYKSIKETQVAMLEQEEALTGMVSVTSVLASLVKLQQVCAGFVIDDDGKIHDIDNRRLEILDTLTGDKSQKYVVWTTFRHCVETISRYLADRHGGTSVVSYYGGTDAAKRADAVRAFQTGSDVRFFVANRAASKGLTLTAACRAIYYTNSYSLEDRLQSEDRIHRIGQREVCFYTDLIAPGTVEEVILKTLTRKKDLADSVITSDWKKVFE